jgi:hypothetical protein
VRTFESVEAYWRTIGRRVFQQQRKIKTIVVDEELLITGVSISEENQRVLNGGVSAS